MMVRRGLRAAADVILPRMCLVCGKRLLSDESMMCIGCLSDMPYTRFWNMSHNPMSDKFNDLLQRHPDTEERGYAYASALFFYHSEADYRRIPYQIKYHGNTEAGRYFGRILGNHLVASPLFVDVDMVIPVPLHWSRLWKRGYNQAACIAAGVADVMNVPLRQDILKRLRRTMTQTKLDIEKKMENVSGAFQIAKKFHVPEDCRHILIVDDVFTTGSTLYACFAALRTVFPPSVRISVATLGFVGHL